METQYSDTLPNDVRSAFDNAIAALPQDHLRAPLTGDEVNSPEEALRWFQDYAFTQGFAVVTASKSRDRLRVDCIHHGKKTRNTRKLPDTVTKGGDRKKELTYVKAKECPYGLYVSYKTIRSGQGGVEERKGWVVGFTYTYHTHPPLQNPFHYACHRSRIPGRAEAVELALAHRAAGLAATESTRILDQHGLGNCLSAKEFYNMSRSEGRRSSREALDLLLTCLEFEDFRVRCHFKYLLDDQGRRTARILEHLFFCSSEQIRLGRRFVSGFLMQTDATFNTNCLHLPLSVIVGITNTGKTFPLAFAFITSESAEAFEFVNAQLSELVWYDCPPPKVVLGDQSKGLTAAMAASQGKTDQGFEDGQILQYCEWHVAQNFKKRLLDSGNYTKERREELSRFIWDYIQSPDETHLEQRREKLLAEFRESERVYLRKNWEVKERQFVRAHTRQYPNLGCNSTQRNEGYHVVVKESLNRQLPLQTSCQRLAESLKKLTQRITCEEDRSRADVPRLLDRAAFQHLIGRVPHYVLSLLAPEWEAAKVLRWRQNGDLEKEREALSALKRPGCPFSCDLPLRYSLPCRHWLYEAVSRSWAIPFTLLHPRWLLDGPPVVRNWTMSYGDQTIPEDSENLGDRYQDGGRNMILQSALEAVRAQGSLSGQQAEEFSRLFRLQNDRLMSGFRKQVESRALLPPKLPEAPNRSGLKEFKSRGSTKRRYMTGCEAAEREAIREAQTKSVQEIDKPYNPPSQASLTSSTMPALGQETRRARKPSAKAAEMVAAASEKIRKRRTKGNKTETSRPLSKKRKVSKEDETRLELQEPPTQECILVDPSQK